jgi:alpha-methylacyl-CoA racemase
MSPGAGALAGVRVVDLTRYIPGPYATMTLADLGADVVKVEPKEGDPMRAFPPAVGEESAAHAALNRGKRSVAVDLRTAEGAAVVRKLAGQADVFVEGFRPGVLNKRGLGPAQLLEAHPRLVYCSVTGFGQEGPHAARAGHDIGYGALGGFLGANRDSDGRPVVPGTQVIDMTTGLLAVIGILAALQSRERTGKGQHVDVSLLRASLSLMTVPMTRALAGPEPGDELTGVYPCYTVYRCRDGKWLAVGALEPKFWEGVCAALGRPELAARQWEQGEARVHARASVAALFASRDRDEWVRVLAGHDVCVEPVLAYDEMSAHPTVAADLLDQPLGTTRLRTVAPPVKLSGTAGPRTIPPAPGLGEHTDAVLAEAGFTRADIEKMRGAGVLA